MFFLPFDSALLRQVLNDQVQNVCAAGKLRDTVSCDLLAIDITSDVKHVSCVVCHHGNNLVSKVPLFNYACNTVSHYVSSMAPSYMLHHQCFAFECQLFSQKVSCTTQIGQPLLRLPEI